MRHTYSIFELNFTLDLSYLYIKFRVNLIEIATSSVYTHTHTHILIHIQKIFSVARSVGTYDSQVSGTFR